eukprot:TRINITY_DN743_c0_g1_i1.p1 TRINITY_DN743_c0_g1~~TRINITY_DN743_c0_g1_i1.p1  ORF type:complete len:263 (-),score=55.89 TRINITY_DN743_c0_g1_i1:271-1059(-)
MRRSIVLLNSTSAINWTRVLFRYGGDVKVKNHLEDMRQRCERVQQDYEALPSKVVEPIDWNEWRKKIATPGIVDAYKAKYEALMSKDVVVKETPEQAKARTASWERELQRAEVRAQQAEERVAQLKDLIKCVEFEKKYFFRIRIPTHARAVHPGYLTYIFEKIIMQQDVRDQYLYLHYAVDWQEIRKGAARGQVKAIEPLLTQCDHETAYLLPKGLVPYATKQFVQFQLDNPQASTIYRAWALKKILGIGEDVDPTAELLKA